MIIVISPAKRLDFSAAALHRSSKPMFLDDASRLIAQLRRLSCDDLRQLMTVSAKIAALNSERFRMWDQATASEKGKQAVLAYCGDVYLGLAADTFTDADFDFAQRHLRILSALYGVLKPLDRIQPYRLEMGVRLSNERGNNMYDFWGNRISVAIDAELRQMSGAALINLASKEYFLSLVPEQINTRIVTPIFKEKKNGVYKVISFTAKRARGVMARYIIKNRIKEPELLKQFCEAGYSYKDKLSTEAQWVYTRH